MRNNLPQQQQDIKRELTEIKKQEDSSPTAAAKRTDNSSTIHQPNNKMKRTHFIRGVYVPNTCAKLVTA